LFESITRDQRSHINVRSAGRRAFFLQLQGRYVAHPSSITGQVKPACKCWPEQRVGGRFAYRTGQMAHRQYGQCVFLPVSIRAQRRVGFGTGRTKQTCNSSDAIAMRQ
jgi:hypothetical protein